MYKYYFLKIKSIYLRKIGLIIDILENWLLLHDFTEFKSFLRLSYFSKFLLEMTKLWKCLTAEIDKRIQTKSHFSYLPVQCVLPWACAGKGAICQNSNALASRSVLLSYWRRGHLLNLDARRPCATRGNIEICQGVTQMEQMVCSKKIWDL